MTTQPDVISEAGADESGTEPLPRATLGADSKGSVEQITLALFIGVPFVALIAAIPMAWGWGMGWTSA